MANLEIAFLPFTIVCLLAFSCAAKDTCSEVQCRVLTVRENLASKFQGKASQEGVRIIYFNLEIGNDSYHPLEIKDEFFPERWVWAEAISEPMLSLPYDYDILSLGLLNYQVRSMTIPLEDHPSGCLASLNSSCQNLVVGRALLDNVTRGRSVGRKTEVICVEMIEKDADQPSLIQLKYHCCSPDKTTIRCGLPIESTEWFDAFKTILTLLMVVMLVYCPAFLLALPDCIFNLRNELHKEDCNWRPTSGDQDESITNHTRNGYDTIGENEQEPEGGHESTELIPIDDASPITCSTLLLAFVYRLPKLRLSFTMKLAIFLFCIVPFTFYVQLGVYLTFKHEYLERVPPGTQTGPLNFNCAQSLKTPWGLFSFFFWAFIAVLSVLFLRPKDLFVQENLKDSFCKSYRYFAESAQIRITLPVAVIHNSTLTMGDWMLFHLKVLQPALSSLLVSYFLRVHNNWQKKLLHLVTCSVPRNRNHNTSRTRLALGILWIVFSILPALLVGLTLVAMCLLLLFVALFFTLLCCSPLSMSLLFVSSRLKLAEIWANQSNKYVRYCLVMLLFILYLITYYFFVLSLSISIAFIVGTFGFTIMGLVLNAQIVTPYVAFLIVVTTNIYLCYANLQSKYKEIKGFILQSWQNESQTERSNRDTIPSNLFWFVSDRAFPVRIEICVMFGKMAAILTFLFLAVSSIIFFGNTYNISTVVSTIAVFVSGVIPGLFFKGLTKGENFIGWRKIKLKREIETAVKEFDGGRGSASINNESEDERSLSSHPMDQVFVTWQI